MSVSSIIVFSFGRVFVLIVFFKQKTAYEMRISDWSSDVCSSDLARARRFRDRNRPSEKRDASPDSRHHLLFPCPIGSRLPYRMREIIFDTETTGLAPRAGHRLVERSEERRVGKEWVRTGRSRWSPYP